MPTRCLSPFWSPQVPTCPKPPAPAPRDAVSDACEYKRCPSAGSRGIRHSRGASYNYPALGFADRVAAVRQGGIRSAPGQAFPFACTGFGIFAVISPATTKPHHALFTSCTKVKRASPTGVIVDDAAYVGNKSQKPPRTARPEDSRACVGCVGCIECVDCVATPHLHCSPTIYILPGWRLVPFDVQYSCCIDDCQAD